MGIRGDRTIDRSHPAVYNQRGRAGSAFLAVTHDGSFRRSWMMGLGGSMSDTVGLDK